MKRFLSIRALALPAMLLAVAAYAVAEHHESGDDSDGGQHHAHDGETCDADCDHGDHDGEACCDDEACCGDCEHHHAHDGHDSDKGVGWFDADNCSVCKPMAARPDILYGMDWETHKIAGGMVMTASISEDLKDDFYALCDEMHAKAPSVAADQAKCGFCDAFGALMGAGVEMEEIKTGFGKITIVTSDDPAVVAKIHQVADRNNEEAAKMAAAEH